MADEERTQWSYILPKGTYLIGDPGYCFKRAKWEAVSDACWNGERPWFSTGSDGGYYMLDRSGRPTGERLACDTATLGLTPYKEAQVKCPRYHYPPRDPMMVKQTFSGPVFVWMTDAQHGRRENGDGHIHIVCPEDDYIRVIKTVT